MQYRHLSAYSPRRTCMAVTSQVAPENLSGEKALGRAGPWRRYAPPSHDKRVWAHRSWQYVCLRLAERYQCWTSPHGQAWSRDFDHCFKGRVGAGEQIALCSRRPRPSLESWGNSPRWLPSLIILALVSYNVAPFPRDNILPRHCVRSRERSHHKPVGGLPPCDVTPVLH